MNRCKIVLMQTHFFFRHIGAPPHPALSPKLGERGRVRGLNRKGLNAFVLVVCFLCSVCLSCATPRGTPGAPDDIQASQRPDLSSDEAGLWMYMDRIESKLKTSGRVMTDPALNAYVRQIVCRLDSVHCPDIRIYIVDTPNFNASMAPNGCMQVWTGLMLRADNEAQLAYVLGHEMAHYLRRHTLQQWRTVRDTSSALAFFSLATAAAGVGFAGDLAQLVAIGAIFAYSRDQEREADLIGFEMMAHAGYEPVEASAIWGDLLAEDDASGKSAKSIFFATHPTTTERIATLKELADKTAKMRTSWTEGRDEYLNAIKPFRAAWLREEVQKGNPKGSMVLLNRLLEEQSDSAEVHFFLGELYRLRGEKEDCENACTEYQKAVQLGNPPPEIYRSMGVVYLRMGSAEEARAAFEEYLEVNPDASDRQIIESYINRLR
jgi:predicted Zn-dependent protease